MLVMDEFELNKRLSSIEARLSSIAFLLESNDKTNTKGLAETVHDLKRDVDSLYRWKTILNTKIVTYAGLVSVLVGFVVWLGDKLIDVLYK